MVTCRSCIMREWQMGKTGQAKPPFSAFTGKTVQFVFLILEKAVQTSAEKYESQRHSFIIQPLVACMKSENTSFIVISNHYINKFRSFTSCWAADTRSAACIWWAPVRLAAVSGPEPERRGTSRGQRGLGGGTGDRCSEKRRRICITRGCTTTHSHW